MLEDITKRLSHNRRGVSNVIVVMLSLLLVVLVVSNVILWSYQMNESDWERMYEDVKIAGVSDIFSPWSVAQGEYVMNVGSRVNGTYEDTQAVDSQYESFVEGLNWWDTGYSYRRQATIVNNAQSPLRSNYSICFIMNTDYLVLSGKMLSSGNDLRVAYWSRGNWIELDREVKDVNSSSTQVWFETQSEIEVGDSDSDYFIYYGNPTGEDPPEDQSKVYLWFDDFNRADNPDITTEQSYSVKTGGGTWSIDAGRLKNVGASGDPNKLIITALGNVNSSIDMLVKINVTSLAGGDYSRMGLSCCMDTSPSRGSGYCALFHSDGNSLDLLNDLRSWGTQGTYSWSLNTEYCMRFRVIDPASKLGKVKVWEVLATEPSSWTVEGNFGGGTARNWGEVGIAGSRTTDTTYFDDLTIRYITEPEPLAVLGEEESQVSNALDLCGTFVMGLSAYSESQVQTVEIQTRCRSTDAGDTWHLKAYNWTSLTYSDSGFNSTSGHIATVGWDCYAMSLTDQWKSYVHDNGTIHVELVDEETDPNQTTVDIDFLAVRLVMEGMEFTLENKAPLTCHLVALWVNNSTHHQRHDISVFINSGDTLTYDGFDVDSPNGPYLVRVVTERGNIAVYSDDAP